MRLILTKLAIASLLALAFRSCGAQTPVPIPITGNLGTITGAPAPDSYINVALTNCSGGVPMVTGYSGIVQTSYRFVADVNGNINGTVWPNDKITCAMTTGATQYQMTVYSDDTPVGQTQCYSIFANQGTWNVTTQQAVACSTNPPSPLDSTYNNLNSNVFFQGNNGAFSGTLSANVTGSFKGSVTGTVQATVNNWQNPLTYGVGSAQSATTVTATGTSGTGALALSAASNFVVGSGVMVMHGGPACGTVKGSACPTGPTPTVTTEGTAGSTSYTYALACIDGLGGEGIAGTTGATSTGNATLAGLYNGAGALTGNYNQVTWTNKGGCWQVAIYRNGNLIATKYTYTTGSDTFNDVGLPTWTSRDLSATPPVASQPANYEGIITALVGTAATVSPNLGANVTSATMYHDDAPLLQAAINASPFVDIPAGSYVIRYPLNYTKHNSSFTDAGEIQGHGANFLCDTGDIGIDATGSQNIRMDGMFFGLANATNACSIGLYVSRDTSNGDLAQNFTLKDMSWQLGNEPAGYHSPQLGGRGAVGIYDHAGEVWKIYNPQFQTARWMVFTAANVDHVTSLFSATDDTSSMSMSQIQVIAAHGSGNVFGELDNAYDVNYVTGYGLGGFLSLEHQWGFEVDGGQAGRTTIQAFRVEGKNGLVSVAAGSTLNEPYINTPLYRCPSCGPYSLATTPQIYLNSGGILTNASFVQIDDYGGSGANFAPIVDGVSCTVSFSTFFVGIWQNTGTCDNNTGLQGMGNTLLGHVGSEGALLPTYALGDANSATWIKLGTWINQNQANANTLKITLLGGSGFTSALTTQGEGDILIRMGNQSTAPNLAGVGMVTYGSVGGNPGSVAFDQVKVAATGGSTSPTNASWDVYVHQAVPFAGGSYIIQKQVGDQWIPISATSGDPGAGSATLVVGTVNVAAMQGLPASFSALTVTGQAAASGTNCLQIDTSGIVTKTGTACGAGGGGGVADVSVTIPVLTAIPANTCWGSTGSTTPTTFTMTGVTTSPLMGITPRDSSNPAAINGYGATGGLVPHVWASASNQGSYVVCNTTSGTITSGAITYVMGAQ